MSKQFSQTHRANIARAMLGNSNAAGNRRQRIKARKSELRRWAEGLELDIDGELDDVWSDAAVKSEQRRRMGEATLIEQARIYWRRFFG